MSLIKSVTKPLKSVGSSIGKVFEGDTLTTMGLYAAGAALMATGYGAGAGAAMWAAAAGAGYGAAQGGLFGGGIQDLATFGASAQQRAAERMAGVYNRAQQERAKAQEETNRKNLLQQIRATRIARANNLADYASETGVTSSGAAGALSSLGSQYLSNTTYAVNQGNFANAYQTYMNQYNAYKAQAQSNAIKWQNRANTLKTVLSLYNGGVGSGAKTSEGLTSWSGNYLSYGE